MRGSPFLQTIFMVVVFALAVVPVYRLTRPAAVEAATTASDDGTPAVPAGKPAPLEVETVFAPAPTDFQVKYLDQTVLSGRGPQARFQTRWTALVPAEGVDLVVQAHWPAASTAGDAPPGAPSGTAGVNPAAARVTVRFADGRQVEKSFWAAANGTLTEVFTVPGEASAAVP